MKYIMSTPVIPPNFRGIVTSNTVSPESIRASIATWKAAGVEVTSFCGHPSTAEYLGVEMHRGELDGADLREGDQLLGVRPLRRPQPGEEMAITPGNFQGFVMQVVESDPEVAPESEAY